MSKSDSPKGVFHGDPPIAHRYTTKWRENAPLGEGNVKSMFNQLALKLECPACEAQPESPCISVSKKDRGDVLPGVHRERYSLARKTFGRKR